MNTLAKQIIKSASFEDCKEQILELMRLLGMSGTYSDALASSHGACDYQVGMCIAKAFDTLGIVPKMKWLPPEIKKLYK